MRILSRNDERRQWDAIWENTLKIEELENKIFALEKKLRELEQKKGG